jgi:hypothetical protein
MFGFQGGESAGTVARKRGYMQDAQQRWGFMTNFDLSTIKNEVSSALWFAPPGVPRRRPRATFWPDAGKRAGGWFVGGWS